MHRRDGFRDSGAVCVRDGMVYDFDGMRAGICAVFLRSSVSDRRSGEDRACGAGRAGSAQTTESGKFDL